MRCASNAKLVCSTHTRILKTSAERALQKSNFWYVFTWRKWKREKNRNGIVNALHKILTSFFFFISFSFYFFLITFERRARSGAHIGLLADCDFECGCGCETTIFSSNASHQSSINMCVVCKVVKGSESPWQGLLAACVRCTHSLTHIR